MGTLCSQLSDSPKTMEQRVRRAVERGLGHIASLGVEDYGNEFFTQYAAVLFPFPRCGLRWPICGEKGDAAR